VKIRIGDLKLRGKIDRIDINEKNKLYNVIDYKLKGRKPSLKDLESGISLQLPVYLIAAKTILENYGKINFDGFKMIIYSLDFNKDNFGPMPIALSGRKKEKIEEIKKLNDNQSQLTETALMKYHSGIKNGKFHLSELDNREEKICRYCEFGSLCRLREVFAN
jgi:ATP-dependent helicase/DNAse subunit B